MISEEAKRLTDGIYTAYGSGSGYLFGITPDKRPAVEDIVQVVLYQLEPDVAEQNPEEPGA